MNHQINGTLLIGGNELTGLDGVIHACNPESNQRLEPAFGGATDDNIRAATALAAEAFNSYRDTTVDERARFLECIAEQIEQLGTVLIDRAVQETGLAAARLEAERSRTTQQLRLFAEHVRTGSWMGVRVDSAQPARHPAPGSDTRMVQMPLGPVAVFSASNFPLAFSVAGGDTASALAAGAPVIVKAHAAHPGTSELVGKAIQRAVHQCKLHAGVFALLHGNGHSVGTALVADSLVKAVGFTGSRQGGTALMKVAAARAVPIPVYAEMSSINPVFLLPTALHNRAENLADDFVESLTMGAGQFCTNPGLLIAVDSPALSRFVSAVAAALKNQPAQVMLSPAIYSAYEQKSRQWYEHSSVSICAQGEDSVAPNRAQARVGLISADDYRHDPLFTDEAFGPAALIVRCHSENQLMEIAHSLEGQLTATLQTDDADQHVASTLLSILRDKAGRLLCNRFPTGVDVCHAMVHGGPYPATADGRSTSVGTAAIQRFLRPVCYQNVPEALLPNSLRASSLNTIARMLDGQIEC